MTLRAAVALMCLLALTGCAQKLPPHVWLPVQHVESVDLYWWTSLQLCTIQVVWLDRGTPKVFAATTDRTLCVERLKADGYDVSGIALTAPEPKVRFK